MVDEVKITVIATGFSAAKEERVEAEVKPALQFSNASEKQQAQESAVPPLLREIEENERRAQAAAVEQPQAPVEEVKTPDPVIAKMEEELASEPVQKKGKELPAFMRKLFRK